MPKEHSLLRRTVRRYNQEIFASWKQASIIIGSVVIGTILIFYIPPLIIARIIASDETITLANGWHYLALFGGVWMLGELLWRLSFFVMAKFESRVIEKLYVQTLETVIHHDLTFFSNRFAGSITKNLLAYARRFEGYFDTLVFGVFAQVGPIIFGLIVLTFISPLLSISLIVFIAAVVVFVRPFINRRSKLVKKREDTHAVMSGHVSDVISNISAVRAFGAEKRELATHKKLAHKYGQEAYTTWHYHNTRIDMTVSPLYVAINVFALGFILSTGIDASSKATLFLAFNYFMNISRFAWEFNGIYRRLEDALTDAALFMEYADITPAISDTSSRKLHVTQGGILFDAVHFAHDNQSRLFEEFSLDIKPGQKIGLVGQSGAGKSSLVNLLLRFSDVEKGAVTIDNTNIRSVSQQSLHESIAYVPQEPILFHRSLADNIAYGKPSASDKEIRRAARLAHAAEFIESLPEGYDTLVGERGVKLSGGQRQRIAIARAILKDAPILVLDEATSALDSESEKLIQDSLDTLMQNRTSIVIAHRLSTIAKLDRIIVLEKGKIIEDGTHTELLKQKGTYAKLWNHQSGGFIEE